MAKRAKAKAPKTKAPKVATGELLTLLDFVRYAVSRFAQARLVFAHGTTDPVAEAAFLVGETLHRAKEVILDLQKTGVTPVAAELKTGFERAWSEIESAFAAARQRAREGRPSAEAPAAEEAVTTAVSDEPPPPPDDPAI